jgi:hypothetical protein
MQIMETNRFRIIFIYYFNNLCNLRNLWIKSVLGCGFAALCESVTEYIKFLFQNFMQHAKQGRAVH